LFQPAGISRLPGTLAVRGKMIENSLAYFNSLATDAGSDHALLLEIARGCRQLAIAPGMPSVANLGGFAGGLNGIRKARGASTGCSSCRPATSKLRALSAIGYLTWL
jgi:hypothetical protein